MNIQKIKQLPVRWRELSNLDGLISGAEMLISNANELMDALNEPEPATEESPATAAPFDPTKPVQGMKGQKAKIYTTQGMDEKYTLVGEMEVESGTVVTMCWTALGKYGADGISDYDLINIPETEIVIEGQWANIYPVNDGFLIAGSLSKTQADNVASRERIACIQLPPIKFMKGDGLKKEYD